MLIGFVPKMPAETALGASSETAAAPRTAMSWLVLDRLAINEHLEVDAAVWGEKCCQRGGDVDPARQLRAVVVAEGAGPRDRHVTGEGGGEGDEVRPRAQDHLGNAGRAVGRRCRVSDVVGVAGVLVPVVGIRGPSVLVDVVEDAPVRAVGGDAGVVVVTTRSEVDLRLRVGDQVGPLRAA